MTYITFRQNHKHFVATFIGHSNAKRTNGSDLVCASVSMLSQALYQGVMDEQERGNIKTVKQLKLDPCDGAVSIDIVTTDNGFQSVLGAFSVIATGCAILAAEYPDNVTLGRAFKAYLP